MACVENDIEGKWRQPAIVLLAFILGVPDTWADDCATNDATPLTVGQSVRAHLRFEGDTECFRLDVEEEDVAVVVAGGQVVGRLLDGTGEELATDLDRPNRWTMVRRNLAPGRYFVVVSPAEYSTVYIRPVPYAVAVVVDGPVEVPDHGLRGAIAQVLTNRTEGTLTKVDMAALLSLEAPDSGIVDLTGLEAAISVGRLEFVLNGISDVSPLVGLANLSDLGLGSNQISDIAALAEAKSLETLRLENNAVTDVSPLTDLPRLKVLDVGGNNVEDVSPLLQIPSLWMVDIGYNPLSEDSVAVHVPALREKVTVVLLDADRHGDSLEAASPLVLGDIESGTIARYYDQDYFRFELTEPASVGIAVRGFGGAAGKLFNAAGDELTSVTAVSPIPRFVIHRNLVAGTYYLALGNIAEPIGINLSKPGRYYELVATVDAVDVDIPDDRLRQFFAFYDARQPISSALLALRTNLRAGDQGIVDLAGLEHATNLDYLDLQRNEIVDLSPLAGLTDLSTLLLQHNDIADISPLSGLTGLETLDLGGNNIADISALAGLTGLTWLSLARNNVTDISALEGMTALRNLQVQQNNLQDLTPLSSTTALEVLNFGGNDVSDVSPLEDLTSLTRVDARVNPLNSASYSVLALLGGRGVDVAYPDRSDSPGEAYRISWTHRGSGHVYPSYDKDYYVFDLTEVTDVTVYTTGYAHVTGRLLDSEQIEIARSNEGAVDQNFRIRRTLQPGTYYVEVTGRADGERHWVTMARDVVEVDIPDNVLRELIKQGIGRQSDEPILSVELENWTLRLDAPFRGITRPITDLTGLEYLTQLRYLRLDGNLVADLRPLSGLDLRWLYLSRNIIADVSPLANMTSLEVLEVDRNRIADVSPLANLTSLEILDVDHNQIADLTPLARLVNLTKLSATRNRIVDIAPLKDLVRLTELVLDANRFEDVSPVSGLKELTSLSVGGNRVKDISQLLDLPLLQAVDLRANPLDAESLDVHVPTLERQGATVMVHDDHGNEETTATELSLNGSVVAEIDPFYDRDYFVFEISDTSDVLVHFRPYGTSHYSVRLLDDGGVELGRIDVESYDNEMERRLEPGTYYLAVSRGGIFGGAYRLSIAEVVNLRIEDPGLLAAVSESIGQGARITHSDIQNLRVLRADNRNIRSLSGLEYAENLYQLNLSDNEIDDIGALAELSHLSSIDLARNRIVDVSALAGLTKLVWLDLDDNEISDISALENLTSLQRLRLARNRITDISPLRRMRELEYLDLKSNLIRDLTPVQQLVGLDHLYLSHNRIVNVTPLSGLVDLQHLHLSDNEIADIAPLASLHHLRQLDLRRNPLDVSVETYVPLFVGGGTEVAINDLHGDSLESATPLALGTVAEGEVDVSFDVDYFRLEIQDATPVAIFSTGRFDTAGMLRSEAGQFLATKSQTTNFLIRRPLRPGVYYVGAFASYIHGRYRPGPYTVRAIEDVDVDIPDVGLLGALKYRSYGKEGSSFTAGEVGVIHDLDASHRSIADLTGLEFAVGLFDLVLNDNRIEDLSPLLDLENLELLDIRRNRLNGESTSVHIPALRAKGIEVVVDDDHVDSRTLATPLPLGGAVRGVINPVHENDHFRLDVAVPTQVDLYTSGNLDTVGRLYSGSRLVAQDDSTGNFLIGRRLEPGTYFLRVDARSVGEYVVHAAVTPVLAPTRVRVDADGEELLVSWTGLAGDGIVGYRVIATPSDGGAVLTCMSDTDATRCRIADATLGVEYAIVVQALGDGGDGPFSGAVPVVAELMRSFWRGWRLGLLDGLVD